jgi:chorismate mutase
VVIRSVRGASGVDRNSAEEIYSQAKRLVQEILTRNHIGESEIINVVFSLTKDLTKGNPATGIRSAGFVDTPLFCVQEADIEGALPRIIRVLMTFSTNEDRPPAPVYLGRAAVLRPDLAGDAVEEIQR